MGRDWKELGLEGEAAKRLTFECLEGECDDWGPYDLTKNKVLSVTSFPLLPVLLSWHSREITKSTVLSLALACRSAGPAPFSFSLSAICTLFHLLRCLEDSL